MTGTICKRHVFVGVVSAFGLLANAATAQVVCDQFEIVAELNGHNLTISLDTDLPEETRVVVGVSRSYYERGSGAEYFESYFAERSTVGKWRLPRKVSVRDNIWKNANRQQQRLMSRIGAPFSVREVSDDITVSFIVPVIGNGPRFGKRNKKLTGKMVTTATGLPLVIAARKLRLPLGASSDAADTQTPAHADNLQIGKFYALEHRVPMAPRRDSIESDDIDHILQLGKGNVIEILEKDEQRWLYRVKATDQSGRVVGSGWIKRTALLNREIREVTRTHVSQPSAQRDPDNRPLVLRGQTGWARLHTRMRSADVARLLGEPGVKRHHERLIFWYYPNENGGLVMFLDGLLDSWEPPPKPVAKPPTGHPATE